MRAVQALLADRKRAQGGSVLSGVLIIVAFLAIISGALMTELSTQLLLSRVLMNRVGTEATVNSAMELALNQLQNTAIASGCPGVLPANPLPTPVTLNGGTAAVSYVNCWPSVRERPQFATIASPASFNIDGFHAVIPNTSQDLYVVGDSTGNIYTYQFGQSSANWSIALGTMTGPPIAMQDAAGWPGPPDTGGTGGATADISYLVPISGGVGSGCKTDGCVEFMGQDVPSPPDVFCFMPASAAVTSRPAAGIAFPQIAYFGDSGGTLYAYNATEFTCSQGQAIAAPDASQPTGSEAIVAGPFVLQNGNQDEVYVVTSSSQLLHYSYHQGSPSTFTPVGGPLLLPYSNPKGLALEKGSVPARVAITFAGGGVAISTIGTSYNPGPFKPVVVEPGVGIARAPSWCACPGGPQIGVAADNGKLYLLDTNLNTIASSTAGSPMRTTPASDGVGEWFVGSDDGYLYELQQPPGPPPVTMVRVARYGPAGGLGSVGSSVQVAGCPAGICIYFGSSNNAYIVPLDARDATITACLSSLPPACSRVNPRLWTQVEVGAAGSPQTVHVTGWSYYSP